MSTQYSHSTLNMSNIKTNSIDFVALLRIIEIDFFKLVFTPSKAEEPLHGMELHENK